MSTSAYVSLWLDEARETEPDLADPRPTELPESVDVAILGGGYTGLWTAIRIKEQSPQTSVVVIEQHYCGYGASGRNGGIAEPSWAKFPTMVGLWGPDEATKVALATDQALTDLVAFCDEHGIDAHIRMHGNVWVAANQAQQDSWSGTVDAAAQAGHTPYDPLTAAQARELTGSPLVHEGVFEAHTATVQPALLARGLRRVAIELGVTVCEGVTVMSYDAGTPALVATDRGRVRAGKVLVAMGAWAAKDRRLKPHLFVTSSDIVATPPLDLDAWPALRDGAAMADSRRLVLYWRSTPDGRIVFGKGGGWMSKYNRIDPRFTGESARKHNVFQRFARLYPQFKSAGVDKSWNGPVDYSATGLPYLGPIEPGSNVFVGVGFSGMGVVQCELAGRVLAAQLLGFDDEFSRLALTRKWPSSIPPDPFRSIGAPLVKIAMERKELLEDADAEPGRLVRLVSGLDPTSGPSQSH